MTFSFDPGALAAQGISPSNLVVVFFNAQGQWENVPGTIVGNAVVADVTHFTTFALVSKVTPPVTPIVTPPVPPPGTNWVLIIGIVIAAIIIIGGISWAVMRRRRA